MYISLVIGYIMVSLTEEHNMKEFEVLSRSEDGKEVAVLTVQAASFDDALRGLNNPMGFVMMMDIEVSGIRDSSGKVREVIPNQN